MAAQHPGSTRLKFALIGLTALGLSGTLAGCSAAADADENTGSDSADSGSNDSGDSSSSGTYTDGTYEAEGDYQSPAGAESISVSVTLADNIVTAVEVTPEATSGQPAQFQKQFAGGISDEVVGKNIDDLDVSRVAGSSLTSGGFNDAIEQIKSDAAA